MRTIVNIAVLIIGYVFIVPLFIVYRREVSYRFRTEQAGTVESFRIFWIYVLPCPTYPDNPGSYCLLGDSLLGHGETGQAIDQYGKALEKDADCFPAMMRLAQVLSASPNADPLARNRAIQLATRACEVSNYQRSDALLTLKRLSPTA